MAKLIFLFVFILVSHSALSQRQFLSYNITHGLSHNSVHCIFKDSEGIVWIGTQDGLNKFDGKNFTLYRPISNDTTSLSDNFVLSIKEDFDKNIWVGTRWGLNKLNKKTGKINRFFMEAREKKFFQSPYEHFYISKKAGIIVSRNSKIFRFDKSANNFLPIASNITSVLIDVNEKGSMLFIDKEKGIFKTNYNGQEIEFVVNTPIDLKNVSYSANERYLVISNATAASILNVFDFEKKKWLSPINTTDFINQVKITSDNKILVAAKQGLIYIENFNKIEKWNHELCNTFPTGAVLTAYQDDDKKIWIGMAGAGVSYTAKELSNFKKISTPIKDNMIAASCLLKNWVFLATNSGLFRHDIITGQINELTVFKGKKITAITHDNTNLWLGVDQEGLFTVTPLGSIKKQFNLKNAILKSNQIFHLSYNDGKIAISTEKNFYEYNILQKTWKQYERIVNSIISNSNYILQSCKRDDGGYWLSCNYGLVRVGRDLQVQQVIESMSDTNNIKRTLISCVKESKKDVWIGTISNGVYKLSNGQLMHYAEDRGLLSNIIYGLELDETDRLWATTSNGLHILNPETDRFYRITEKDGISKVAFSIGSMKKEQDGNMYIGCNNGLLIVNPDDIKLQSYLVKASISNIKINGKSIDNIGTSLTLYAAGKNLEVEFSVSNGFQYDNVFYQYRIKGLNDSWVDLPVGSNVMAIGNLPFRKFNLEYRAAPTRYDFDKAPIYVFTIIAKPPFYYSWWFITICVLSAIAFVGFVINFLNKAKYQKKLNEFETQKKLQLERERIGRDLHDNIGAYSSALIAGLNRFEKVVAENANLKTLEEVSNLELNNAGIKKQEIENLKEFADNIMSNLRETIWVLNTEKISLLAFVDRFKNYLIKMKKLYPNLEIETIEEIENNKELSPEVALNSFRILQEAYQNSCKHAKATKIIFAVKDNPLLSMSIKDNGIGFDSSKIELGHGLDNMKERANTIGYRLIQESVKGLGTITTLVENNANEV